MEGFTNAADLEERYNDAYDEIAKMKELLGSESDEESGSESGSEEEVCAAEGVLEDSGAGDSFEAGGGQLGAAEYDEEDEDYLFRRSPESELPPAPTQPRFFAELEESDEEDLGEITTEDRLLQEGEARANRLEQQRQEEFMREQESNSALAINAHSRELQSKMVREGDINDQLARKQEETQKHIRELQMRREKETMEQVTLTPKINAHSRDLMDQQGYEPLTERMEKELTFRNMQVSKMREAIAKREVAEVQDKPTINKKSQKMQRSVTDMQVYSRWI
jgi:hypothetical protein